MPEDVAKHFALPNFNKPVPGTPREVIDNATTTRDNISLGGLWMKKGKSGGAYIMPKTVMEVAQYYTVLDCRTPIP